MFGLVKMEGKSLSGHLSNINEITFFLLDVALDMATAMAAMGMGTHMGVMGLTL